MNPSSILLNLALKVQISGRRKRKKGIQKARRQYKRNTAGNKEHIPFLIPKFLLHVVADSLLTAGAQVGKRQSSRLSPCLFQQLDSNPHLLKMIHKIFSRKLTSYTSIKYQKRSPHYIQTINRFPQPNCRLISDLNTITAKSTQ